MNTEPMNALNALDRIAAGYLPSSEGRKRVDAIRAAVAELIAADNEYDEAHAEFYAVAMDRETANERYMRQGRYITARKRRAAALARVQGGA